MKTLRPRSALRLLAAALLVVPVAACDDKKASAYRSADAKMAGPAGFAPPPPPSPTAGEKAANTEAYEHFVENAYIAAGREPRSTFSASVDTAAYALIRAKINEGQLPPKDAVRIETALGSVLCQASHAPTASALGAGLIRPEDVALCTAGADGGGINRSAARFRRPYFSARLPRMP